MIYYVATYGNNSNSGTLEHPFQTIQKAAEVAVAGDTVRVFGGTYREWVDPKHAGHSDAQRITYEAVDGERPIIKGSEIVTHWEQVNGSIWKKTLPNSLFGDWNPYALRVEGDWLIQPIEYDVHLGDVYINGVSMYEAASLEDLYSAVPRTVGCQREGFDEPILCPAQTVYRWLAQVEEESTTLLCNFGQLNPNAELIEINVRKCCFFPQKTGINYITVRGFEMAHAATPWAPPTADQPGMLGPHWSHGWIIENNLLHDSKCSGISLGKEISTGDNLHFRTLRKSGHIYQMEAVFQSLRNGWHKGTVGSHILCNNVIYDCGQAGIVGHMGGAFSRIENNHVYNIAVKHEFWGHEIAGIKLHAAVDTLLLRNHIHHCGNFGTWLDWQAQGMRVSQNVYHHNARDFFIEVSHGPCTVDHNLFLSEIALQDRAQGTAFVHNLFAGVLNAAPVLKRTTPYHLPHSTEIAGVSFVYGGDDRFFNNLFLGSSPAATLPKHSVLLAGYDGYTTPQEYTQRIAQAGHRIGINKYLDIPQPLYVEGNAYGGSALPWYKEESPVMADEMEARLLHEGTEWILLLTVPASVAKKQVEPVTTERLGAPRVTEASFENPDGTPIDFSIDLLGRVREERICIGPFTDLQPGLNRIKLFDDPQI